MNDPVFGRSLSAFESVYIGHLQGVDLWWDKSEENPIRYMLRWSLDEWCWVNPSNPPGPEHSLRWVWDRAEPLIHAHRMAIS